MSASPLLLQTNAHVAMDHAWHGDLPLNTQGTAFLIFLVKWVGRLFGL